MESRSRNGTRGIALIAVLWTVLLLTLMALMVLGLTRTQTRIARRYAEIAQAEVAADSAINLTLIRIGSRRSPSFGASTLAGPAMPDYLSDISVSVGRESERVDLNAANLNVLGACFQQIGFKEADATSLAARVADWRDADDVPSPGGAEAAEYRAGGLHYGPRNGPFETVEELRRVLGLGTLKESALGFFTVYTHDGGESSSSVVEPGANSGSSPMRRVACRGGASMQMRGPGGADDLTGQVVRIRACARRGVRLCRVSVARLTGSAQSPFQVFIWRTETDSTF